MSAAGTAVTWRRSKTRDRITNESNLKGGRCFLLFLLRVTRLKAGVLCAYGLLTRCKEQRDSPHASLHELSVDALHVSGRQAVFIISVADGVNPGQVRHVAKQHHPLEERFLRLVTTCMLMRKWCSVSCNMRMCYPFRSVSLIISVVHMDSGLRPVHTWIGEDPCGDVRTSAHDVLHIQTGFDSRFSRSLSAHNTIHLSVMLEAPSEQAHELS